MDEIEKVLRKANKKDRERLLAALLALRNGQLGELNITKLTNSSFYRVRIGDYRIIFSVDQKRETIVIETIRLRNERTYT